MAGDLTIVPSRLPEPRTVYRESAGRAWEHHLVQGLTVSVPPWSTDAMRLGKARWIAALSSLALVAVGAGSTAAAAGTNLVANGTFEGSGSGSLTGWAGSNGSLSLVTGNGGGHAASLTANAGAASTYA